VAAILLLGCGKTPDSFQATDLDSGVASGAAGSGGQQSSGPEGGQGGTGTFACSSEAEAGDMVTIPAADFSMGCEQSLDPACEAYERPAHTVTLAEFEIDRTEVTQDAYTACVEAGACGPPDCEWDCEETTLPAACVTWAQARAYCTWRERRLPTEAEWEKAARGVDGRLYPWGDQEPDCDLVNMAGCGDEADPVGTHPSGASPYGALDMAGTVGELVNDFDDESYYASSPARNPMGPESGTRYVGRGGGYRSTAAWQRAASRDWYDATDASEPMGFRCAR